MECRYDKDWFYSIDDKLNDPNNNKPYSIILKEHQDKVYQNNLIKGFKTIYIKQTNKYYVRRR